MKEVREVPGRACGRAGGWSEQTVGTGDGSGGGGATACADKTVPGPSIFRPPPGSSLLIKFDEGGCKLYDTAPGHLVSAPWECILKLSERSSFYQNTEPRKLDLEKKIGKKI